MHNDAGGFPNTRNTPNRVPAKHPRIQNPYQHMQHLLIFPPPSAIPHKKAPHIPLHPQSQSQPHSQTQSQVIAHSPHNVLQRQPHPSPTRRLQLRRRRRQCCSLCSACGAFKQGTGTACRTAKHGFQRRWLAQGGARYLFPFPLSLPHPSSPSLPTSHSLPPPRPSPAHPPHPSPS